MGAGGLRVISVAVGSHIFFCFHVCYRDLSLVDRLVDTSVLFYAGSGSSVMYHSPSLPFPPKPSGLEIYIYHLMHSCMLAWRVIHVLP